MLQSVRVVVLQAGVRHARCASSSALPRIAVCGGGNAAHVMVGDLGSRGYKVNLYAPHKTKEGLTEADIWNRDLPPEGLRLNYVSKNKVAYGKPYLVTDTAEEAVKGCKFVFIPLPVFAHRQTLQSILPHVEEDTVVIAMPATGCFDWTATKVMEELGKEVTVAGIAPLPYVCRTLKYAVETNFNGQKAAVGMATLPGDRIDEVAHAVEAILQMKVKRYPSFLPITLTPTNPIMHTGRLMGMFGPKWRERTYSQMIKFYEDTDDYSNYWLHKLDEENMAIARAVEEHIPGSVGKVGGEDGNVLNINRYLKWTYGDDITKWDSCKDCYKTNPQFAGVGSPMKKVSDDPELWEPDFENRYFTEDFPFGLMANRGIAELVGVPTPGMDEVITWAQSEMGKEWLVDGKVNPSEKPQVSPQAFGFTLKDLKRMYSRTG